MTFIHLARSIFICSLLVAKGSYSLNITEQSVDLSEFLRQSVTDLQNFAYMEGVSVRVRKEDIIHKRASSDFNRIRQVIHSKYLIIFVVSLLSCSPLLTTCDICCSNLTIPDLVSNAIKFSDEDINIEL